MEKFNNALRNLFLQLLPFYIGKAHEKISTKIKADTTPVTDLDNLALRKIRALIKKHFPADFTIGEEDKKNKEEIRKILARRNEYQWTIDGLDGTWHYANNSNSYGAMVSRRKAYGANDIVYAAIFRPVDQALRGNGFFCAERGLGAKQWCKDDNTYHKIFAPHETKSRLVFCLEGSSKKFPYPPIITLQKTITARPSLSTCIAATIVASGSDEGRVLITVDNKPWDNWPAILLIEEAGGIVTDWSGNKWTPENCGNIVAAANEADHGRILQLLNQKEG